jgi:tRNA A-37 threonylcarbamoyl transferase component Bud32
LYLAPGRTLSYYRLIEQIGEGGMGVVWKATDTSLGRDIAIKVLPEALASDRVRMARFEREARLLASLNHPNIASIYGVGAEGGVRFLAMELVEGDDLAVRVAQGPVPVVEALEMARQIAEALEAAHEKGVIHRDLKPANVKVTPDGTVKVLDFGLAKAVVGDTATSGATSTPTILPTVTSAGTAAGMILGTAAYMSPEQARGKAVDRRADIWAFGCVLFECLTGHRAFGGETASDTLARILEREPDLAALPGATPPRVRELLQRCLAKDPKLRLRDIGDARIALTEVLAARSPSGRLLVTDVPGDGSARRRGSLLTAMIFGVIGLGVGAGLWSVFGPRPSGSGNGQPTCVTVAMPPNVTVQDVSLTRDGRTLVVTGRPKNPEGSEVSQARLYTRPLDRYEFKELPGTEGVLAFGPDDNGRSLTFVAPVSPGAPQKRLARMPIDGSAPATTITDWKDSWSVGAELENGDSLIQEGPAAFVRLARTGGGPSAAVKIDAGRPGVSRYEFTGSTLPGDRGAFVNVVSYDTRGWHYSVGVMDVKSGKVRVIEEDGGNALYSPTGHILFARGDAVLAAPFDPERLEVRGAPVAVWSGLISSYWFPGRFTLTSDGALFYRPGQPWSSEQRAFDAAPELSPDGRRFAFTIINARGIDEIWVSDLARPEFRRLGTDSNADCMTPIWSPDGKRIAYTRRGKDGRDGIYVQDAEGGEAKRILKPDSEDVVYVPRSWLPDGSALLLTRTEPGRVTLAMLPVSEGEVDSSRLRPLLPNAANRFTPRLSRSGRLLAFGSDESGKALAYVAEFHPDGSTGRPIEVKTSGSDCRWSADDKSLFVLDERRRLTKVMVTTGPELSVSAPTDVHDFETLRVAVWSVLPDGRFFVGLKHESEVEITRYDLVLNWTEELKRKLRAAR